MIKIDPELLRIMHAPLYTSEVKTVKNLVADSEVKDNVLQFTKTKPGADWQTNTVANSFGTNNGPVDVKKSESVWAVNSFNLTDIPDGISLKILAFGSVKVYLNGKLVLDKRIIGKRHYEHFNISEFGSYLKKGKNQIAVEAVDFEQAAQLDFGLYSY
jgi:hypothetical protein